MNDYHVNSEVDLRLAKKVYSVFFIFSLLWLVLIFLAPLFMSMGGILGKLSSFIYLFFSKVCHQQDNRSFHILDHKFGVCSRCVWIYAAFFLGTAFYPLKFKINNIIPPSIWILVIPVILILLDVIFDSAGIIQNTFLSRSVTGFFIGFVLPLFIIPGFVKFFYEINSYLRNKVSI